MKADVSDGCWLLAALVGLDTVCLLCLSCCLLLV